MSLLATKSASKNVNILYIYLLGGNMYYNNTADDESSSDNTEKELLYIK
jgi:hypothetical protein